MTDPCALVLAFDTSAAHCAASLLHGGRKLVSRQEEMSRGQAERLFPLLEEVLSEGGATWSEIATIGVGIGPGNFTGIRISVAAARGLALSLGIPAVGVSTLAAAAHDIEGSVTAVVDARRGRVYRQDFPGGEARLDEIADLPTGLRLTGPASALVPSANIVPAPFPVAEAIARIAANRARDGSPPPAPLYIRAADAAPSRDKPPMILDDT